MGVHCLRVRGKQACHHELSGTKVPYAATYRARSRTVLNRKCIHINRPDKVINADDKYLMHKCFDKSAIKCAEWQLASEPLNLKAPLVAKHRLGSRGIGVYLLKTDKDVKEFIKSRKIDLHNFILERFKNFRREYRMHVWAGGCFYSCRKALQRDCPDNLKWKMNDSNCTWFTDQNKCKFLKPENWEEIESECVKALDSLGLDVVGFDVKVADDGRFFIVEANSAPTIGSKGIERYKQILPSIVRTIRWSRGFEVF